MGSLTATIPVGQIPVRIAAGAGSVWVPNTLDGTLSRIDPATNQVVATIDLGADHVDAVASGYATLTVAASDTAVWVTRSVSGADPTHSKRELLRIDPTTNAIVATTPLDVMPQLMAYGEGAVWITSHASNVLLRIDADTNQVVASIPLDAPLSLAAGDGAVWVVTGLDQLTLTRVDPASNTIVDTYHLDTNALWFAVGGGSIWMGSFQTNEVLRIDEATHAILARVQVIQPGSITYGLESVWVNSSVTKAVARIDPATNTVVETFPNGNEGGSIAIADGVVWVSLAQHGQVIRIDP
jgi:YVTN family beta-propeller protein